MSRRLSFMSSLCFCLASSSVALADTHASNSTEIKALYSGDPYSLRSPISLSMPRQPKTDWLESVSIDKLPPGSLIIRYDGLHNIAMKQLRGQCRQLVKRAAARGWYVQPDATDKQPYRSAVERDWVADHINGAWWTRSWMESLTPERGGAPEAPYVHTYGQEIRWKRGALSFTNTMKFKFDYIGLFELNTNPVESDDQISQPPVSLDVSSDGDILLGTSVVFKVKPRIRIGAPKAGNWDSAIRSASIQVSFDVVKWGKTIARGEIQASWRSMSDMGISFDVAIVTW